MNNRITARVFGIDLGTTNSVAAIFKNGKVDMVVDKNGSCITPSYVHFPRSGNPPYICGFIAKEKNEDVPKGSQDPLNCKRLIGAKYDVPL